MPTEFFISLAADPRLLQIMSSGTRRSNEDRSIRPNTSFEQTLRNSFGRRRWSTRLRLWTVSPAYHTCAPKKLHCGTHRVIHRVISEDVFRKPPILAELEHKCVQPVFRWR